MLDQELLASRRSSQKVFSVGTDCSLFKVKNAIWKFLYVPAPSAAQSGFLVSSAHRIRLARLRGGVRAGPGRLVRVATAHADCTSAASCRTLLEPEFAPRSRCLQIYTCRESEMEYLLSE